jgi:tetratricopeptide (TPR) repeat protein
MTLLGLGRGNYILALDETDINFAIRSRNFYETAYQLAKDIGDQVGMIKALVPTTWYQDFWPEYADQARQNAKEAFNLSLELGNEDLILDSKLALAHTGTLFERERLGAELQVELESRRDLPRLNILLFRLMFTNLNLGNFEKAVQVCEAGFEVAKKIGVPPVQYATIRALAYIRLGRFDDARRSLEEEVADEAHRFGKAFRDTGYGIYYLEMLAYKKARETLESSIEQADLVGRAWLVNSGRFYLVRALVEGGVGSNSEIKSILKYFDPSESPYEALIFGHFALSNGNFPQALEMANTLKTYAEESGRRPDMASALLLKAQTLLVMEQVEEAVAAAEEGVQLAVEMDYLPVLWRLRGTKAEALERLGRKRETANEFKGASDIIEELAGNISEDDLRNAFLSNPIVTSILAAAKTKSEEQF